VESIARSLPAVLTELLRDAPLSPGKVEFAWNAAVGHALGRATRVRLEGGVLLVEADTAQWGREVMRSSPIILRRLQRLLGPEVVRAVQLRD
jgi:predicted nucleic acid-binding Zn ribbon protein